MRPSAASPVAAKPERSRLVHLLRCRRADRVRAVRRGLSDDGKVDPGRYRLGAARSAGMVSLLGPSAGRRAGRSCEIRAAGGAVFRSSAISGQRAGHTRALADLPGRILSARGPPRRSRAACSGPAIARDQPGPRRPRQHRQTVRTQRPLCIDRQWLRRRADGRLRIFLSGARGVHRPPRHCCSLASDLAAALRHDRSRLRAEKSVAEQGPRASDAETARDSGVNAWRRAARSCGKRPLLVLACCARRCSICANAAMLPLMGSVLTVMPGQEPMGDGADRGLHRGAAGRRRR